jgi:large subunit ribosomal protein L24
VAGLSLAAKTELKNVDGSALSYRGLTMPAAKVALRLSLSSEGRSASALVSALSGEGVVTLANARLNGLDPKAIMTAVSASDQMRVGDDAALRRLVEPALANGAMLVTQSEIPFVVKDGRLRVNATPMETADARALVSGGYDLTADQADLRVTLSALNMKGVGSSLPEIQLFAAGPPDRMTRAIDIAPLSSWLAIRAIDRETKRLEALERNPAPSVAAVPPAEVAPPPPKLAPSPPPASEAPQSESVPAPLPRPRVAAPSQPSAQSNAPALPPAIEVGPPPGTPRRVAPRPPMAITPSPAPRVRSLDAYQ